MADLQGLLHGYADFAPPPVMNKMGILVTTVMEKTDVVDNFSASVFTGNCSSHISRVPKPPKRKKISVHIQLKCRPSNRQAFLIRIMPLSVSELIKVGKQKNMKLT